MRPDPTTSQRRRRRQASQISNAQAEMHGELFSLERLEEYATELGTQHKSITRRVPARPLLAEAEKNGHKLEEAYTRLAEATGQNALLMPGDEWLLDNYHIVRDTVDEVRSTYRGAITSNYPGWAKASGPAIHVYTASCAS